MPRDNRNPSSLGAITESCQRDNSLFSKMSDIEGEQGVYEEDIVDSVGNTHCVNRQYQGSHFDDSDAVFANPPLADCCGGDTIGSHMNWKHKGSYDANTDTSFVNPLHEGAQDSPVVPHHQRVPVEFVRSMSVEPDVLIPLKLNPPSILDSGLANSKNSRIFSNKKVKKIVSLSHLDPNADIKQGLQNKNMVIQLKGLFHACDGNDDGFLYKNELEDCLRMIGFTRVNDTLLNKYIVVNHEGGTKSSIGGAKVSLDVFVDVTIAELAIDGIHSHATDNGSEIMGLVMKDIAFVGSKDLNNIDGVIDDITLRSLHHYLSEVAFPSILNTHEYKKFVHALGLCASNKHNDYMKLVSREKEYGIQFDKLLNELLICK